MKTQSGNDLDLEDGKNSEEPAINSKPTLNLHPAEEIQPTKWRKRDAATSTLKGARKVKTQSGNDMDLEDGKNSEEPAINSKPTLNLHPAEEIQPRKWRKRDAATSTLQGARIVKTQSGNDLDLEDCQNSEEPAINSKPTLNLHPAEEIQPRKWRKRDAATSTLKGARKVKTQSGNDLDLEDCQNSEEPAINSKPTLILNPAEELRPRKWRKRDAATSTLQGARIVKTQSGNDLDLEDGKNSEEPAINSKPTLNLHPAEDIQRKLSSISGRCSDFHTARGMCDAVTSTLQGARVKKGHEFRGFGQLIGDGAQKRENTSDREQEARGCLGQEECNQLKSKIIQCTH